MKPPTAKSRYVLSLIAGISVLLFSSVAVARILGWLPNWTDASGDVRAVDSPASMFGKPISAPSDLSMRRAISGKRRCPECGVIASTREIDMDGAVDSPGAPGQAGGANDTVSRGESGKRYEFTIRLTDGSTRVFSDMNQTAWRVGERVSIIDGVDLASR